VLGTIWNRWVGFGSISGPEPNCCNRSYHTKTWTVAIGLVLPPKTCHFNITSLAPIKYLSSDCIVTWSIRKLCSFMRSFTSRFQICDLTNICWVAIENPRFSHHIWTYFTAIQRILVGWQIWRLEAKEHIKLYNLIIDHVTILSELRYLIGAKVESNCKQP